MRYLYILLLFISTNIYSQQATFEGTGTAPNFFGYDLNENYHELNTYLENGKIVVLEFMNIYCGACQAYAPVIEEFYSDYGPSGTNQIELIAIEINSSTDDTECEQYMSQYNSNFPLINGQNSYYYGYEAYYTPTFYIIFPDGSYTNYCSNICLNSTSTSQLVNDFGNIIDEYYSLNSPWGNDPDTDCNSTILIQPTTNITLNNEEIPLGSWIGVFFNNEDDDWDYGGGVQWNGEVTSIAAWGSEAGLDNGFASGEEFTFGIYDSETNQTIFSNNSEYSFGENSYSCNGLSGLTSISFETNSENNDINPWGNDPDTDCNSTILIQPTTNITLNNEEIPLGSWIGVFFNNENDELIYGGGVQWNGEVTSIAAWGSEAGLDNGFASGEEFTFGIYDSETNQTIFSNNSEYSFGENSYSCNGLSGLTSISFETNSENNNCSDDNNQMSAFGGCSEAISLLGCNFNFGGTLIEDICPVSCNNCENSNEQQIEGCTNENALNYDPNANIDDGSCLVLGCTDVDATNFNPSSNLDDGSCEYEIFGCTEETAFNYNENATTDDGSCIILGCTDSNATNYSPQANTDDASCNYNSNNDISPSDWVTPDTDCNATILISSLTYMGININGGPITNGDLLGVFYTNASGGLSCGGYTEWTGETTSIAAWGAEAGMDNGFQAGEEYIWYIFDVETQQSIAATSVTMMFGENFYTCNGLSGLATLEAFGTIQGCTDNNAYNYIENAEEDNGSCCYTAGCLDETAFNYDSNACFDDGSCIAILEGCTDPNAFNYNNNANTDDESCCYIGGCTDPNAFNYDSSVCFDDESCVAVVEGCTDSNADNFNPQANIDDESCEFFGCMDIEAWNYNSNANIDDGSCFFSPFGPEPDTDCNATILIPGDVNITIDEQTIPFGTWIGVFYSDSNNELSYGGGVEWNGEVTSIAAWGAEGSEDNGFQNGEIFTWGIYNLETNEIIYTNNVNYSFGDGSYSCNGLSGIESINIITTSCNDENAFNYIPSENDCESCCCYTAGCLDETAFNYDSNACFDDGSCIAILEGCTDPNAFNYNNNANTDDESCCYIGGCTDPNAFNYDSSVCFDDESCVAVVEGCTDSNADNFNPQANIDDESCEFFGCMDIEAWNYNSNANIDDGSCFFSPFGPEPDTDCNATILIPGDVNITIDEQTIPFGTWIGVFYSDSNNELSYGGGVEWNGEVTSIAAWGAEGSEDNGFQNGEIFTWGVYNLETNEIIFMDYINYSFGVGTYSCNGLSGITDLENIIINGCTNNQADNYNPEANTDDGSCQFIGCTQEWADNYDPLATTDDGSCDRLGCIEEWADNYDPLATTDDGSCDRLGCMEEWADNYDPLATTDDGSCDRLGCMEEWADNYDPLATTDDGSCDRLGCMEEWADNYDPLATTDDGSCDRLGCMEEWADNYDPLATTDDGSCDRLGCMEEWADNYDPLATTDDGSCDRLGCMEEWADNYDPLATTDDGSCDRLGCMEEWADNYDPLATTDDGSCDRLGCMEEWADNYDPLATTDDGSCDRLGCMEEWADNYDPLATTDDGSCDRLGCMEEWADNYDPLATTDDGSCDRLGCMEEWADNYDPLATTDDGSCDRLGCMEEWADNYDPLATTDDGSCDRLGCMEEWADNYDPLATTDDGSCDRLGCMEEWADNYDPLATTDDGSCDRLGCMEEWADNYDPLATTDDGSCDRLGCMEEWADNYDPLATTDDGSCDRLGCMEEWADNYDPLATTDDGSCDRLGCMEEWADNYDPLATTDDGSCDRLGCMEEWADNYDPLATTDDGSCQYLGCTSVLAVNYDSQANVDDGSCDYGPWGPLEPTGTNHNIAIPTFATLTFDGEPINNGDWIGLFYLSDETGELVNGGSVIWTGEGAANMVAWGAEAGMDNGFQEGEEFIWMIWDAETQETLPAVAEYDESMPNTNLFANNGLSALTSLQAVSDISQTINLTSGWSLWSTYVHPDEANISTVVEPIISSLDIVKDWEGNVYWPLFGINTIGDLTRGEGYQIKTTSAETLTITGDLTPSNYEINLPNGWFIMGFLHTQNKDAGEMMAPIYDDLIILKDYLGNVYWPMFGINTIGTMEPGKGYQIKTMNPFTYSYPQGNQARYGDVYIERPVHFDEPVNTGNNMIIGLPLNAWETAPSIGDEIAAYGEDGTLIGSTTFQGDHIALTIWGDDLTTNKKEGISEGETISFKLWNSQTGIEQVLEVRWSQGVGFYTTDGISVAGQIILGSELTTEKQLVKITDVLGREVNGDEKDIMLLYIYDDGSIERVYTKE